jgi:tetrahydromethanopterin S-methyltransferase subunit F
VGEDSWQRALPKGYEDVRYLKDLIARKKELDGVDHSRRTAKDAKSK